MHQKVQKNSLKYIKYVLLYRKKTRKVHLNIFASVEPKLLLNFQKIQSKYGQNEMLIKLWVKT
jgi:hypothetical protein